MVRATLGSDGPEGESKIVPVKFSADEKADAIAECEQGETLSAFVRLATRREVIRRRRNKKLIKKQAAKKGKK